MPDTKPYDETYRPQFHFSAARNWLNDPNGLVYYAGEYHLFFQHNPHGKQWGNMTWGHAVSSDLLHWQELDCALHPDELGTMFSGSAVTDRHNTSGLQEGSEPPIICLYTAAGEFASPPGPFTQCLAFSNNRGRSFTKYAHNPVLDHIAGRNRDPRVLWHEPTGRWIMALYLEAHETMHEYAILASSNLIKWEECSRLQLPGSGECPDLFPLAVDGNSGQCKWVFWTADGHYLCGDFDGERFTPDTGVLFAYCGGRPPRAHAYAAQTFSDIPQDDGRTIQIAWFQHALDEMPFTHFMTFPVELSLRTTAQGLRLCSTPVREIAALHRARHKWSSLPIGDTPAVLEGLQSELWDIMMRCAPGSAPAVVMDIRGMPVVIDACESTIRCGPFTAPLEQADGCFTVRILVDRCSLEIFSGDGLVSLPFGFTPAPESRDISLSCTAGRAEAVELEVYELVGARPTTIG